MTAYSVGPRTGDDALEDNSEVTARMQEQEQKFSYFFAQKILQIEDTVVAKTNPDWELEGETVERFEAGQCMGAGADFMRCSLCPESTPMIIADPRMCVKCQKVFCQACIIRVN